jgi:type I restriction enzyme M protein
MDFNATTHGQRDIDDDRLSNLIERVSEKRLGLNDVEADIIGRSYEYLIRKFAEGSGQSAGEFFTPPEVARIMALITDPQPVSAFTTHAAVPPGGSSPASTCWTRK